MLKKMFITVLKIIIFFMGWTICTGLGTISSDNPVIWRLGAETLPLLYILIFSMMFWLIEKRKIQIISFKKFVWNICVGIGVGVLWLGVGAIILGGVSLADDYPHLLNLVFSGNKLLSGGDYKMEGSIVVLILNVLLSISFYFFLKKRNMDQEVLK